jgi:hypothetical protein
MVQGLMSDLGPFLQSKFEGADKKGRGKRKGDWVTRPEVEQVFDQVIAVLKSGLGK